MSYILDALKKAERERGIKQVPTLMTDHAPPTEHRNRIWAILSILVLCVAVVAWYFMHSQKTIIPPHASAPEYDQIMQKSETSPKTAPAIDSSVPTPVPSLNLPASQKSEPSPRRPAGTPSMSEAQTALVSRSALQKKLAESALHGTQANEAEAPIPPMEEEEEENTQIPEIVQNRLRPNAKPAGPASAQSQPASLQEAMSKMTLSLLLFADNKAERMVFINNKKYAEGDYVEGIYFLESITPDGAILSYQGERALLRPKSK
jgi:general secretion pathway protein B